MINKWLINNIIFRLVFTVPGRADHQRERRPWACRWPRPPRTWANSWRNTVSKTEITSLGSMKTDICKVRVTFTVLIIRTMKKTIKNFEKKKPVNIIYIYYTDTVVTHIGRYGHVIIIILILSTPGQLFFYLTSSFDLRVWRLYEKHFGFSWCAEEVIGLIFVVVFLIVG